VDSRDIATPPQLSDREALILQLHYADGWSLRRIARGIGCDHANVTRQHRAALEHLRACCGSDDGPFEAVDVTTLPTSLVEGQ
jgi:hypothetical protein